MTTSPADVLARLQAAWRTAPTLVIVNADSPICPRAPLQMPTYCSPHNDPDDWNYTPDNYGRRGYRTVHCRRCGRFVGYQPMPDPPGAKDEGRVDRSV